MITRLAPKQCLLIIRWSTVVLLSLLTTDFRAFAQEFPYEGCHIETSKIQNVQAILHFDIVTPQAEAREWLVLMPMLPELPGQTQIACTMWDLDTRIRATVTREFSAEHRVLLSLDVPSTSTRSKTEVHGNCLYSAQLNARKLVAGISSQPICALQDGEREQFLAPQESTNYNTGVFQDWLTRMGLRCRRDESPIAFAWRAFNQIRNSYTYSYIANQDRHATNLCGVPATDCGGLSILFVSVLRANGIPARTLFGRWAKSETSTQNTEFGLGEIHVKSEFYIENVGWIPVELSGAVSNKKADALEFFGRDRGEFITFHVDTDMTVSSHWFGNQQIFALQNPSFFATGKGTTKGYKMNVSWQVVENAPANKIDARSLGN